VTRPAREEVTSLLARWRAGDRGAARDLVAIVYGELHRLAGSALRGERRDHTLQATALVHEACLRLLRGSPPELRDRLHFYAVAARLMRRILVDHARRARAGRRGGAARRVSLTEGAAEAAAAAPQADLVALDEALAALAALDRRKARVVELRYFAGLTVAETADVLAVSVPTVVLDTRFARSWLAARLLAPGGGRPASAGAACSRSPRR
jgi:RNA polymerase sigma factor (TIGR02999 family)